MTTTSEPTLTIVIATKGRDSLADTIRSATPLRPGDEILVLRRDCAWGHAARNEALQRCNGTHLLFIDDDDTYAPGALDEIRDAVREAPDRVHLFAMRYTDGDVLEPAWPLQIGRVSTQMMCVPNRPELLGRFGDRYEGDYDFVAGTIELRDDEPVLHTDTVIAHIGPPAHARAVA